MINRITLHRINSNKLLANGHIKLIIYMIVMQKTTSILFFVNKHRLMKSYNSMCKQFVSSVHVRVRVFLNIPQNAATSYRCSRWCNMFSTLPSCRLSGSAEGIKTIKKRTHTHKLFAHIERHKSVMLKSQIICHFELKISFKGLSRVIFMLKFIHT